MSDEKDELNEENVQENKGKDKKKFEDALKFVQALVGGPENLTPKKKVKGDKAAQLVAQLFKNEREQLHKDFTESLAILLKKYLEMKGEIAKKQKELDELTSKKEKEFTKAVNDWKNKVEQSEIMNQSYADALKVAFTTEEEVKS